MVRDLPDSPTDTLNGTLPTIGDLRPAVTERAVKGLLCNAFEGGSNYWYLIDRYEYAPGIVAGDFKEGGRFNPSDEYWHPCQIVGLVPGCAVVIEDMEDGNKVHRLDRAAIERGLMLFATKHQRHFADWISGNDDATTGDVFLQCCLLGDVIYG